jgi:hypothetical protein
MKKASIALLVLLMAALPFALQGQTGWIKYNSPEGRYSVLFPGEPKLSTQDTTAATGEKMPQYLAMSLDADAVYMVGYFDSAPNMTFSFDKARDGFVAAVKGTLLGEKAISLDGNPGRELKVLAKISEADELIMMVRFFQAGMRIYVIQLIVPKSSEAATSAEKNVNYFDSFRITRPR